MIDRSEAREKERVRCNNNNNNNNNNKKKKKQDLTMPREVKKRKRVQVKTEPRGGASSASASGTSSYASASIARPAKRQRVVVKTEVKTEKRKAKAEAKHEDDEEDAELWVDFERIEKRRKERGEKEKKKKKKKKGKKGKKGKVVAPAGPKKRGGGNWRSFASCREFARYLELSSQSAWKAWSKVPENRPDDVPSNPQKVYKDKGWKGYGDFLGNGQQRGGQRKKWRSFASCREFARSLELSGQRAWNAWRKVPGNRPDDVPSNPHEVYKDAGWTYWGDFLGSGSKAKLRKK